MTTISPIENIRVSSLKPHDSNPRKHSKKQIKQIGESIKTFGFRVPVLVDDDNRLICGHGRVKACQLLGIENVPAIRATGMNESEIRAFMIADNRLAENAQWDDLLLAENFEFLADSLPDFDLEITGFDYGEIENLIVEAKETIRPEPAIPDVPTGIPVTRAGDIWLLGSHRIICGDSRDPSTYDRLFTDGRKAAMIFTDPPYNLSAREIGQTCEGAHGDFEMGSGEMSRSEFAAFLESIFSLLRQYSSDGSIHYICMDWRHIGEMISAGDKVYDELKNLCVWVKSAGGMGTFYRSQHELIFAFKAGKAKHQNHFQLGQHGRYRSNVWNHPSVMHLKGKGGDQSGRKALKLHPTIKPVALVEDALRDCSRRNEIVLDSFLGSGTTLLAADNTERICYGVELSPRYVDVAVTRWQEWTGEDAVHEKYGCTFNDLKLL